MKVVILYEGDPECVDPLDSHHEPRKHFEEVDGDVIVLWRTQTDVDSPEGHDDLHFVGQGIFGNVTIKQARQILRKAGVRE